MLGDPLFRHSPIASEFEALSLWGLVPLLIAVYWLCVTVIIGNMPTSFTCGRLVDGLSTLLNVLVNGPGLVSSYGCVPLTIRYV